MQKFIQFKEYLLELSFLALLIRIVCVGAEMGTALAVVSVVISMAYNKWLTKSKVEQYDELKSLVESKFNEMEVKHKALEEISQQRFDNIAAKFSSQNLENAFTKKATDLQKLVNQVDEVLNGDSNVPQQKTRQRYF